MGGIITTLLGTKHGENMRKEHNTAQFIMEQLHEAATNPNSALPDETVDWLVKQAGSIFNKDTGAAIKTHFDQIRAAKALKQSQAALPQAPQGQAPPAMGQQQPAPQATMPKPPEDDAGPLESAGPKRPFEGGAPAGGSAPVQESPALKVASQASQTGFGGPAMPAPPAAMPPPPSEGSMFRMGPAQRGVDAAAAARPGLEGKAQVEREQIPLDFLTRKATYGADPAFSEMSKRQQLSLTSGQNITPEPHFNVSGTTVSVAGDIGVDGQPIPEGTPGTRFVSNGQTYFSPAAGKLQFKPVLGEDGKTSSVPVNTTTGKVGEANPALTSAARVRMINITHPDGSTSKMGVTSTGQWASDDPRLRGVNPAMLPTTTNSIKLVQQADGTTSALPVTAVTSKGARGSGGGAGVGDPIKNVGAKSLTPGQIISLGGKAEAYDAAIQHATSVQSRLPLLNSLIDAKKIDLQIDPAQGIVKAFINRSVPLSPEEAKLAGDFSSLMESINMLRGPLGAGGFKGQEAFSALQAQRGQLTANPAVTARVLENTLKTLQGQRDVIRNSPAMPQPPGHLPPPPAANVKMRAPTGQEMAVPADQVEHYKAKGAVVVQ